MKQHQQRNKHLNRAVFNEWGLYTFIQMLVYKSQLYGKDLIQGGWGMRVEIIYSGVLKD